MSNSTSILTSAETLAFSIDELKTMRDKRIAELTSGLEPFLRTPTVLAMINQQADDEVTRDCYLKPLATLNRSTGGRSMQSQQRR
jgi:hypothetical protein